MHSPPWFLMSVLLCSVVGCSSQARADAWGMVPAGQVSNLHHAADRAVDGDPAGFGPWRSPKPAHGVH
jgi:hypothetical protein